MYSFLLWANHRAEAYATGPAPTLRSARRRCLRDRRQALRAPPPSGKKHRRGIGGGGASSGCTPRSMASGADAPACPRSAPQAVRWAWAGEVWSRPGPFGGVRDLGGWGFGGVHKVCVVCFSNFDSCSGAVFWKPIVPRRRVGLLVLVFGFHVTPAGGSCILKIIVEFGLLTQCVYTHCVSPSGNVHNRWCVSAQYPHGFGRMFFQTDLCSHRLCVSDTRRP